MDTGVEDTAAAFAVEGRHTGGVTALRVMGRLVAGVGAGHPAWQAGRDWRGAARVVVDLAGVTAIDAGGVGALLQLRQSAGRHGVPVVIEAAAPRVRRVLQLVQLEAAFGLGLPAPGLTGVALSRCA